MNMILYKWLSIVSKYLWVILLVSRALSKGSLKLFSDGLILLLLSNKFILQPVNLFLEFLNWSLSKLSSGLRLLQLGSQRLDLLLVAGLPFIGLLLRDFKRLQVAGNNSQLLLKLNDLHLASLCSFLSSLKLTLNLLQSLGNLIVLLVSFLSLVSGILEFLLKLAHSFLILDSPVLQHLPHSVRVISSSGSLVQLVGGLEELVLTSLQISLKTLDSSVKSIDLKLSREEVVLLLLKLLSCQRELLLGLVKLNLKLLSLLDKVSHLLLSLGCSDLGVLCSLLTESDLSMALSFSTFMACIFLMASMAAVLRRLLSATQSKVSLPM